MTIKIHDSPGIRDGTGQSLVYVELQPKDSVECLTQFRLGMAFAIWPKFGRCLVTFIVAHWTAFEFLHRDAAVQHVHLTNNAAWIGMLGSVKSRRK